MTKPRTKRKQRAPSKAWTVVEGIAGFDYSELKDCLRCENCNGLTLLTWEEYLADAWRKRFWCCGQCGNMIDPYNQKGIA